MTALPDVIRRELNTLTYPTLGCKILDALKPIQPMVNNMVEKVLLTRALEHCHYNQFQCAKVLGINRNTLRKKLDFHGLLDGMKQKKGEWMEGHGKD